MTVETQPAPYNQNGYSAVPQNYPPQEAYIVVSENHHHHHDSEAVPVYAAGSNDIMARKSLVRKVLLLVVFQMLIVIAMCSPVVFIDSVNRWFIRNNWIWILAIPIEFISLFMLFCFRKKKPLNFILLLIFTVSTGYMIASTVCFYDGAIVVEAAVITFIVTVALMGYTLVTKADFTFLAPFLFCSLLILVLWGSFFCFAAFFWVDYYWLNQIYCVIGVFIFVGYILFDTSRLVHCTPPDEYMLAAVSLYLDILNLFLLLLALLGGRR